MTRLTRIVCARLPAARRVKPRTFSKRTTRITKRTRCEQPDDGDAPRGRDGGAAPGLSARRTEGLQAQETFLSLFLAATAFPTGNQLIFSVAVTAIDLASIT